jgi:predicted N-acetyltransferase YhbS
MTMTYKIEPDLSVQEFANVLTRSTLAERRPMQEPGILKLMLQNADVIATARSDGKLVGISRAITDFAFCTYLSDLAVDEAFQKQGIGQELIRLTHETAGHHTTLILLAAPNAETYYPKIGMTKHNSCWTTPRRPIG